MKNNKYDVKKEKRGMYIALGICLLAVSVAAFGTYSGLQNFIASTEEDVIISVDKDTENEDDPEIYAENDGDQEIADEDVQNEENIVNNSELESDDEITEETDTTETENSSSISDTTQISEETYTETAKSSYSLKENYISPVSSDVITEEFSDGNLVYNSTMGDYRVHNGIDITAALGETVYACNAGEVISCYYDMLLGNVIIIEHGEYEFWYCGLGDTFLVEVGDIISSGTAIGSVKTIPSESDSTHIHLQISKNGEFIDPAEIIF